MRQYRITMIAQTALSPLRIKPSLAPPAPSGHPTLAGGRRRGDVLLSPIGIKLREWREKNRWDRALARPAGA